MVKSNICVGAHQTVALLLILPILAGLVSAFVVRWILRNGAKFGLVQEANHRSSHLTPTPAGGGVGVVAGTGLSCLIIGVFMPEIILPLILALVIAGLGFADDRRPIAAKWRLLVQALALCILIFVVAGPFLDRQFGLLLGLLAGLFLIVCGVWWVNLYNFLDGIDGYASVQGLIMLWGGILISLLLGDASATHPLILVMTVSGTAIIGFLVFNWPPARIFMGDAGSTFMGFWIFALALFTVISGWMSIWQWAILSGLFLADASVTLLRRLLARENIFQAHRNHAYQKCARAWGGHLPVLRAAIALNLIIVLPAAILAGIFADFGLIIAFWLVGFLCILAFVLGAGQADKA